MMQFYVVQSHLGETITPVVPRVYDKDAALPGIICGNRLNRFKLSLSSGGHLS